MNIKWTLLEDKTQNKAKALLVAEYACASPANFKELMHCFIADDYRLAQRAAWSVSWAVKKKPALAATHIKTLVAQLKREGVHAAVIRNSVRVLEMINIPAQFHGEVMNACFNFIERPATPAAIKAFSLATLYNLSKLYPEIKAELKLIIEEQWENETPAFKSRGKKILRSL